MYGMYTHIYVYILHTYTYTHIYIYTHIHIPKSKEKPCPKKTTCWGRLILKGITCETNTLLQTKKPSGTQGGEMPGNSSG